MTRKMLIDAAHPEETRVVVTSGSRVDEFDFETQGRRQLRGNIYLARVTRVEPSLQAAFVEYGGNRHGFLAFGEIHPDYYQLPYEDRQKLIAELDAESRGARERADVEDEAVGKSRASEDDDGEGSDEDKDASASSGDDEDDGPSDHSATPSRVLRKYKIQEVIKRRQILLVQVVKEERGNKGAALTTYMSLAGRYCVLMPNTARGGGISRKITSAADRKRLKKIVEELDVPGGMALIVRTAGSKRTRTELKRDYDYLIRLWETVRERTLSSSAPALIHEESNLVKRSVRDLYDKDIEAILVEGDAAYREAKDFVRMLMPSHAKKVQPHREAAPIFMHHHIESQLTEIYDPTVQLRSGGYLVINQTEALVAIDVNSGRATRERNIETTALKTNLEAAEEACRQFRLRDLAGLIVIDFIDMEESRNVRAVEKRLRDCLKDDRARIQVGKISQFGLLEMSRQRRRSSVLEGSHDACPVCEGRGVVRSVESSALHTMRAIEAEVLTGKASEIRVRVAPAVSLYVLNEKRAWLTSLESRYAVRVLVEADESLRPPALEIVRTELRKPGDVMPTPVLPPLVIDPEDDLVFDDDEDEDVDLGADDEERDADDAAEAPAPARAQAEPGEGGGRRRRRRRRGGRRDDADAGGSEERADQALDADADSEVGDEFDAGDAESDDARSESQGDGREEPREDGADRPKRRRRRGRRGGRGRRNPDGSPAGMEVIDLEGDGESLLETDSDTPSSAEEARADVTPAPAPSDDEVPADATSETAEVEAAAKPKRRRRTTRAKGADVTASEPVSDAESAETTDAGVAETDQASPAPTPGKAAPDAKRAPEPQPAPEPEPVRAMETSLASNAGAASFEPEQTPPPAAVDPDAAERRKRWQDRLKSWLNS